MTEAEAENEVRKIPVLTVVKNNSVLKNIFILQDTPESSGSDSESEESLWIGRHPDCNVILEHPSISRFHLRIDSKPYQSSLSVTDLSSVHGTWVCEKKIEPNVRVELNEGDTLRLGGSTRIYRLHWVPMSTAYDLEYPFVPPMDMPDPVDEKELEVDQSQAREASKEIDSMLSEMKITSSLEESFSSDPLIPTDNAFYAAEGVENNSVSGNGLEQNEPSDLQLCNEDDQESDVNDTPGNFSSAEDPQMVSLLESPDTSPLRSAQKTALSIWSKRGNCASVQVFTCKSKGNRSIICAEPDVNSTDRDGTDNESISRNLFPREIGEDDKESSDSGILYTADQNQRVTPVELEITPIRSAQKDSVRIWCSRQKCEGVQIINDEVKESCQSANSENSTDHDDTATESISKNIFFCKDDEVNNENGTAGMFSALDQSQTDSTLENSETPPVRSAHKSSPSIWSRRGKSASVQIETSRVKEKRVWRDTEMNSTDHDDTAVDFIPKDLCPWNHNDIEEMFTPDKENLTFDSPLVRSSKKTEQDSMKNKSILKSVASISDEDGDEIFTPDKENITPDTLKSKSIKKINKIEVLGDKNSCRSSPIKDVIGSNLPRENQELPVLNKESEIPKSVTKCVASSAEEEHENKVFTPNEENVIPDTLRIKSVKKMRKLEVSNPLRSSPLKNMTGSNLHAESHVLTAPNSKNQLPEVILGQQYMNTTSSIGAKLMLQSINPKGEEDGVHSQPSLVQPISNATMKDQGQNDSMRTSGKESISHPLTRHVRNSATRMDNTTRWTMVVDTASLLNKESRQALTFMQGLKRTNLIIPSIVVRELDGIKRRGSFFKRTTEASAALQWIEDCIENAKWWIHVQSYVEEARTIAATPPVTPLSCYSGENRMFSPYGALLDTISSPTSDDHVLECALFFRTFMNGRLVLLTNDVTLKIKAMTEGLLCESAEQFREGLVNPFSDRFLWADSSPVGPTWSFVDDVVLQGKYYRGPLKNLPRSGEAVKGLKLILLHNSQHMKLSPISPMA